MGQKIKVIVTGATGMVGEGVLHECLKHPDIEEVLVVTRRSVEIQNPKLKELIIPDFFDLEEFEYRLQGYNACFFCLGVSSVGLSKEKYYRFTYTLTLWFAKILSEQNMNMTFCYISGAGTDSREKGFSRWARVKGKTENALMKMPFGRVYAFRPGFIRAIDGMKRTNPYYKYIGWIYPIGRMLYPNGFNRLEEIGLAMIEVTLNGFRKNVIKPKDIAALAREYPRPKEDPQINS